MDKELLLLYTSSASRKAVSKSATRCLASPTSLSYFARSVSIVLKAFTSSILLRNMSASSRLYFFPVIPTNNSFRGVCDNGTGEDGQGRGGGVDKQGVPSTFVINCYCLTVLVVVLCAENHVARARV